MCADLRATYRLQLHRGFSFADAATVVDYLAELGVSHLYLSPVLQARPGSTHGYDVVDPTTLSSDLGGEAGFARLRAAAEARGCGLLLDIVPNHMAIAGRSNRWWWDVLEHGAASRYAHHFDIDWEALHGRVSIPVLGDPYGAILARNELQVSGEPHAFVLSYHEHEYPLAPASWSLLLADAALRCASDELAFYADALAHLPPIGPRREERIRRHRMVEVIRTRLACLRGENPSVAAALAAALGEINTTPSRMDDLLERQNYRLVYWRTAQQELGYRRFFDINELIALRVEDEQVFNDTHAELKRLIAGGGVDGLRVDHPDGLRCPGAYLRRLAELAPAKPIFVEKVLEPGESLPREWPVAGTTGYDFLQELDGVFIDAAGEDELTRFYAEYTGCNEDYHAVRRAAKRRVLQELLISDVDRLVQLALAVCAEHWQHRDYTRLNLQRAVIEIVAAFPVYRTYLVDGDVVGGGRPQGAEYVEEAVAAARGAAPELDRELAFIADLLRQRLRGERAADFVARFQQLCGPAMAKGAEDTSFYTYNRLVALNEVGSDPGIFGISLDVFHAAQQARGTHWPANLLASTTHDTKRSEDARARLIVLAHVARLWTTTVLRWTEMADRHRPAAFADRNMEYLLYQTLVAAWPISPERLTAYLQKAAREAKAKTSWIAPDAAFESALRDFAIRLLADAAFSAEVDGFVAALAPAAQRLALARTLIKLTAPGTPDIYQGCELWDTSLVDPDNRRPVDFAARRRLLAEEQTLTAAECWRRSPQALAKLCVIRRTLELRRLQPDPFAAAYQPLGVDHDADEKLIAFARGDRLRVVVPRSARSPAGQAPAAAEEPVAAAATVARSPASRPRAAIAASGPTVALGDGNWRNVFTGAEHPGASVGAAELLRDFPVALLIREDGT